MSVDSPYRLFVPVNDPMKTLSLRIEDGRHDLLRLISKLSAGSNSASSRAEAVNPTYATD